MDPIEMRLKNIMTSGLYTLKPTDTVAEALARDDEAFHHPASLQIGWLQVRDDFRDLAARQ